MLEALFDLFTEEHFFGIAFGQRETREDFVAFQLHITLFGKQNRVIARFREVFQRLAHLFLGLHVELVVRELEALFLGDSGIGANAQHNVLRHCVFLRKVVEVVGGDGLQTQFMSKLGELAIHFILGHAGIGGNALVLKLNIEIARFIECGEFLRPLLSFGKRAIVDATRNNARNARTGSNDTLGILLEHFKRGARTIVEIVYMRFADQLQQVVITRIVLGQKDHMVKLLLLLLQLTVGGEVDLATKNRLNPLAGFFFNLAASFVEFRNARHNTVVGDSYGRHIQIGCALNHVIDVGSTVKQRILSVAV